MLILLFICLIRCLEIIRFRLVLLVCCDSELLVWLKVLNKVCWFFLERLILVFCMLICSCVWLLFLFLSMVCMVMVLFWVNLMVLLIRLVRICFSCCGLFCNCIGVFW